MMKTNTLVMSSLVAGFLMFAPVTKADETAAPAAKVEKSDKKESCECGDCKKNNCAKKKCSHCKHDKEEKKS
jgi:hypothetical protein